MWHTLALKAEGERYRHLDGKQLFTARIDFLGRRQIALWTKADSVTRDRIEIKTLP